MQSLYVPPGRFKRVCFGSFARLLDARCRDILIRRWCQINVMIDSVVD